MYTKILAIVATIAASALVIGCSDKEEDTGDTGEVVTEDTDTGASEWLTWLRTELFK